MDLLINKKNNSVSLSHVPHAVYIFAKLTVRLSLLYSFCCSPLSVCLGKFYCTWSPVYIVNIYSEKKFALYTSDSNQDHSQV